MLKEVTGVRSWGANCVNSRLNRSERGRESLSKIHRERQLSHAPAPAWHGLVACDFNMFKSEESYDYQLWFTTSEAPKRQMYSW